MKKVVLWTLIGVVAIFFIVNIVDFATDGGRVTRCEDVDQGKQKNDSLNVADEETKIQNETSETLDTTEAVDDENESDDNSEEDAPQTEDEKREAEEEKLVNSFDDLTDKWQEPTKKSITMADIDNFAKSFRKIPKARQDECIHRALNLIPDENVMLLAGVLMDKSMDKEIIETVYNDILNRDEDVKKPILQEIFKDKTHPCWADTAWILDVTGELPKKQ